MSGLGLTLGALASGIGLGAAFFGGLWWTVRCGIGAVNPGVWFGVSALLRMAVAVSSLYFFARLGLPSLAACLCGLLVGRGAIRRLTRIPG